MFERDAIGESSFGVAARGEGEEEEEDASAVGTREVLGGAVGAAIDDGRGVVHDDGGAKRKIKKSAEPKIIPREPYFYYLLV